MGLRTTLLAVTLLVSGGLSAAVTQEQAFSYILEDGGRFSIETVNGSITVVGGSGNAVDIIATKKGKNQQEIDKIEIVIDDSPDAIRVKTEFPSRSKSGWFNWGDDSKGSVSYTISLPASANLESIESVNGGIEIAGVIGTVKASTTNGSIRADDLSGNTRIETVNGSVTASFASLSGQQKAVLESVNGRLTVSLPANSDVSVSAETINGGIDGSAFNLKTDKGFIGRELEGDIGSGSARLAMSTVNGGIKIKSD